VCVGDDCNIGIGTKTKRDPDVNVVVVLFVVDGEFSKFMNFLTLKNPQSPVVCLF